MTYSILSTVWINNKFHILLPEYFCDYNRHIFYDLKYDRKLKGFILPPEQYKYFEDKIVKTMAIIFQNLKDGLNPDGTQNIIDE